CGDRVQPRLAIRVRERDAATHLRDVLRRMERVPLREPPAQPRREERCDGGLPAPGDAHDYNDGRCHRGNYPRGAEEDPCSWASWDWAGWARTWPGASWPPATNASCTTS